MFLIFPYEASRKPDSARERDRQPCDLPDGASAFRGELPAELLLSLEYSTRLSGSLCVCLCLWSLSLVSISGLSLPTYLPTTCSARDRLLACWARSGPYHYLTSRRDMPLESRNNRYAKSFETVELSANDLATVRLVGGARSLCL